MFCGPDDLSEDEEPDFTSAQINNDLDDDDEEDNAARYGVKEPVMEKFFFGSKYKAEDLYPTVKDPSCDPKWALAAYWPVYVGNFRPLKWQEETWYKQVSDYFASKGLLTRMIYFHEIEDELFTQCQKKSQILDMLVYFTTKNDAEKAMNTCHRDSYYGHYLNVFHGRRPEYFVSERTVRFEVSGQSRFTMSPSFMEHRINHFVKVEVISRITSDHIYVQFATVENMLSAVGNQYMWRPSPLKKTVMKQRFVEGDVKMGIDWAMQSKDSFMDMQPSRTVVNCLLNGHRPKLDTAWQGHKLPMPSDYSKIRRKQSKQRIKMLARRSRKDKTMNKKKLCQVALKIYHEPDAIIREEVSTAAAASETPDPQPGKTYKQKIADTVKAVNWFLRIHGKPAISKAIINARLEKLKAQKKK